MIAVLVVAALGAIALLRQPGEAAAGSRETSASHTPQKPRAVAKPRPSQSSSAVKARPSDKARLKLHGVIAGNISPKSVASSGTGYVTAQNMMYRHSVTVYDARSLKLVKTISDAVNLRRLGYPSYPGTSRGAPVEAAFSSDALRLRLELLDVRGEVRAGGR